MPPYGDGEPPRSPDRRSLGALVWARLLNAEPAGLIVNGMIALALSLATWEITHNLLGWLALFLPGAALVIAGWYVALKQP